MRMNKVIDIRDWVMSITFGMIPYQKSLYGIKM